MTLFDIIDTRVCTQCGERKLLGEFYLRREDTNLYRKECKVCVRTTTAEWRQNNLERHKELNKKWLENNREKAYQSSENWRLANMARFNAKNKTRRAARRNATPSWLNFGHFVEIEGYYIWCSIFRGHHVDHVYPIKNKNVAGLHVPWNLQILTEIENKRKNNKMPDPATIAPYIERPTLKIDADGFASLEFSDD